MVFTIEHNTFIVMAYFVSVLQNENGWPLDVCTYPNFAQHCGRIVKSFVSTGNVGKGKSHGRPTDLT
jgi:hypothetical protein